MSQAIEGNENRGDPEWSRKLEGRESFGRLQDETTAKRMLRALISVPLPQLENDMNPLRDR